MLTDDPGLIEPTAAPAAVNRQEYKNSPLADSAVEAEYAAFSDKLFNDRQPNLAILSEKPEHRIICFLKAQGKSNKEIAEVTGYTYPWISQVLRQPWARQRVLQIITEAGADPVAELLKSTTVDSVFTLINIRDNEKALPATRVAAANSLLDRVLGKPVQHIEADVTRRTAAKDVAEIDQQLKGVEEQLQRYGVASTSV